MVDRSLLRLAADRGVTICFADLDGADGLWLPEERTILVSRLLSERAAAEVIEHELGHVDIDDRHAELDAGVGRRPPAARSRRWAVALAAAASLAVVGGVTAGLAGRQPGEVGPEPVVAPSAPALTGPGLPAPAETTPAPPVVVTSVGRDGKTVYRTVTRPAPATSAPSRSASPTGTRAPAPTTARPSRSASPAPGSSPPPSPTAEPTTALPSPTITASASATASASPAATPTTADLPADTGGAGVDGGGATTATGRATDTGATTADSTATGPGTT